MWCRGWLVTRNVLRGPALTGGPNGKSAVFGSPRSSRGLPKAVPVATVLSNVRSVLMPRWTGGLEAW